MWGKYPWLSLIHKMCIRDRDKKTPVFLKDDSFIYFVVIVLLIIIFLIESMFIYAASAGLVLVIITAFTLRKQILRNRELKNYLINYTKNLENLSINSFYYLPLPICIISLNGKVFWYNNKFKDLFPENIDIIENVDEFVGGFPLNSIDGNKEGTLSNIEVPETVSYTHLDVYKRQPEVLSMPFFNLVISSSVELIGLKGLTTYKIE